MFILTFCSKVKNILKIVKRNEMKEAKRKCIWMDNLLCVRLMAVYALRNDRKEKPRKQSFNINYFHSKLHKHLSQK